MENYVINGNDLKNMLIVGATTIKNNADKVNELNVFPVPDGDTGTNMTKTMEGGIKIISNSNLNTIGEVMLEFSKGALMGASGNSGVILSQIIKGISNGLKGLENATVSDLANAFSEGVKTSYSAVEKPVEGTILTVFREATEFACQNIDNNSTVVDFLNLHVEQAKKTLAKTKELLPVLKDADVIDSGGAGYVYIAEGMLSALSGDEVSVTLDDFNYETPQSETDFSKFTSETEMVFGYCTEVIIRLQKSKTDIENFDVNLITDKLKDFGCDSIVAYKFDDAVKLHTHTFTPGIVLNECQKYGEFLSLKIENMTLQHTENIEKLPRKKLGVVAVVNGDGLESLFYELGADVVINGGQTLNPSAGDFINAFESINAEHIIVLPNNSNIYLSAKQAEEMYKGANVHVMPVKTIQEGYVALLVINPEFDDIKTQINDVKASVSGVDSIEITHAIRDAVIGGVEVKNGEYMAIFNGKLLAVDKDKIVTAINSIKAICESGDKEVCTVFLGKNLTQDEVDKFTESIEEELPDVMLNCIDGGQDVYDFLISLE